MFFFLKNSYIRALLASLREEMNTQLIDTFFLNELIKIGAKQKPFIPIDIKVINMLGRSSVNDVASIFIELFLLT